ncbi:MAG: M20/M25/M40 family metallo-hydrolase [Balneolaceae bacterium]|nr:M20/M25/M40 family metallo-hydrolase [Balneolaceae bacterium]
MPGRDPDRNRQAVTYLAHYDHVGFGEPEEGDAIWNGFIDNASGTAVVLELARIWESVRPAHPVLFLFTSAEEQGLLGANWFVHRPPVKLDRIKAVINIDGGFPPGDIRSWNLAASPSFRSAQKTASRMEKNGHEVMLRPLSPDSDHWPFHKAGIPALFLYPSRQADSDHIHTPDDEWQDDFPFEGLRLYAEMALLLGQSLQ